MDISVLNLCGKILVSIYTRNRFESSVFDYLNSAVDSLAFIPEIINLGILLTLWQNDFLQNLLKGEPAMARRVVIDTEECIGCESCVELCAEVFAFNEEEEKAEVIMPEGGPEDCIEEAIETCPVECIRWED